MPNCIRICAVGLFALVTAAAGPLWAQPRIELPPYQGDATFAAPPAGGAALDGTILDGSAQGWDPYGNPNYSHQQQPGVFPQAAGGDGYPGRQYIYVMPDGTVIRLPRLLQRLRGSHTWVGGDSGLDVEWHTTEVDGTFGFPFLWTNTPLFLTPGIAAHFVDGPDATPGAFSDLPDSLFDAFLDVGWQPQITPQFGVDLGVRVGVYGEWDEINDDSIRVMGRGLAIFTSSPQFEWRIGVIYVDRLDVKILPAGGLIWTPNPDWRWEVIFPQPKLAWRVTTIGLTDWWFYVAGEYGGGQWTLERFFSPPAPVTDTVDYSDLRVILGLEWIRNKRLRGNVEVGYVFNREVQYRSGVGNFDPDDTFMVRMEVAF